MLVADYARACGVVNRTIIERIERGKIAHTRIDGLYVIDATASPFSQRHVPSTPKAETFQWPPAMPPHTSLVWIGRFAEAKNVRADALFRAVLFGDMQGWGVGNRVLVRQEDAERIIKG